MTPLDVDGSNGMHQTGLLSQARIEEADAAGFFLVEDLISAAECQRFAERLQEYASGSRTPGSGVSLQREPAADGDAIRKISGLYGDDLFRTLISHDSILPTIQELVGGHARLFRADALMKPPVVGSVKGVHQDSPYWPIRPMSLWSCWIPFDDATIDNGCLTVISGSHCDGGREHVAIDHDYVIPSEQYDPAALVPVPMRRGTAIFFHSLLHSRQPGKSIRSAPSCGHHELSGARAP